MAFYFLSVAIGNLLTSNRPPLKKGEQEGLNSYVYQRCKLFHIYSGTGHNKLVHSDLYSKDVAQSDRDDLTHPEKSIPCTR